jgi:hypothetical protein
VKGVPFTAAVRRTCPSNTTPRTLERCPRTPAGGRALPGRGQPLIGGSRARRSAVRCGR